MFVYYFQTKFESGSDWSGHHFSNSKYFKCLLYINFKYYSLFNDSVSMLCRVTCFCFSRGGFSRH